MECFVDDISSLLSKRWMRCLVVVLWGGIVSFVRIGGRAVKREHNSGSLFFAELHSQNSFFCSHSKSMFRLNLSEKSDARHVLIARSNRLRVENPSLIERIYHVVPSRARAPLSPSLLTDGRDPVCEIRNSKSTPSPLEAGWGQYLSSSFPPSFLISSSSSYFLGKWGTTRSIFSVYTKLFSIYKMLCLVSSSSPSFSGNRTLFNIRPLCVCGCTTRSNQRRGAAFTSKRREYYD